MKNPHKPAQTRKLNLFAVAAIAFGASVATCFGGELVDISVEIDGWTILPIADQGVTTHLIASRDDDEVISTDIDVVLYERLVDGWAATAYDPQVTKEDAMMDIANEFGLSDPRSGDWMIDLDEDDFLEYFSPRVSFGKGFFVTDPLHNVAQHMSDPEPLAEGAEQAGLAAGSSAINTGTVTGTPIGGGTGIGGSAPIGGCGCEDICIQDSISAGVDAYLADATLSVEDAEFIATGVLQSRLPCCLCWSWRGVTTSVCTGGAWAVTGSGTIIRNGVTVLKCTYSRPVTIVETRTLTRRHWNCTRTTTTQTRTITGTQATTSETPYFTPAPPPCPGAGAGGCGLVGPPTAITPWAPAPPPC